MNTLILVALSIAAPPAEVADSAPAAIESAETAAPKTRTRAEWVAEVRKALRHQAQAEPIDQAEAYVRLISLYQELSQDDSLHYSERQRMSQRLRSRLLRISEEFYEDLQHRQTKIETVQRRAEAESNPEKLKLIEEDQAVLAQWDGMLGQVLGGAQGGGGQEQRDYGEDLVELIQKVIAPDFWDVAGGPGTIVYYKSLRVLVISATGEVHEQIGGAGGGGLLGGLRRAGGGAQVGVGVGNVGGLRQARP